MEVTSFGGDDWMATTAAIKSLRSAFKRLQPLSLA
jgi:hypothetical protein